MSQSPRFIYVEFSNLLRAVSLSYRPQLEAHLCLTQSIEFVAIYGHQHAPLARRPFYKRFSLYYSIRVRGVIKTYIKVTVATLFRTLIDLYSFVAKLCPKFIRKYGRYSWLEVEKKAENVDVKIHGLNGVENSIKITISSEICQQSTLSAYWCKSILFFISSNEKIHVEFIQFELEHMFVIRYLLIFG